MKKLFILPVAISFVVAALAPACAGTVFLSRTGGGATCSSSAPCNDMATALTAAGASGAVICLDRGVYSGYFFLSITNAVTISCGDGLWVGSGSALNITLPAGAKVIIEGFVNEGASSVNGINFLGQGELELLRVRVSRSANGTTGLVFKPNGAASLRVSDSSFLSTSGTGILISPLAGVTDAHIRNTLANGNAQGGITVTQASGATAKVALEDVTASGNSTGLNAGVGTRVSINGGSFSDNYYGVVARGTVDFTRSVVSGNQVGIYAPVPNGSVTLAQSRIFGNVTGLLSVAGGKILSFGNNAISGNTTDGAPTAPALLLK